MRFLALLLAACASAPAPQTQATPATLPNAPAALAPPVAVRNPHSSQLHGRTLVDDYYWLRQKGTPEVEKYLAAENAYTDAMMKATEPFQKTLYDEMLARIEETDVTVPYRKNGFYYYARTVAGKQYPILCRKSAAGAA